MPYTKTIFNQMCEQKKQVLKIDCLAVNYQCFWNIWFLII